MELLIIVPIIIAFLLTYFWFIGYRIRNVNETIRLPSLYSNSDKPISRHTIVEAIVLNNGVFEFDKSKLPEELSLDSTRKDNCVIYAVTYIRVAKNFNKVIGKGHLVLRITDLCDRSSVVDSIERHNVLSIGRTIQLD